MRRFLSDQHRIYVESRGWVKKDIEEIGVFSGEDNLSEFVCFPLLTYTGDEVGLVGRRIDKKEYRFVFKSRACGYFLWRGLRKSEIAVLCEGPFDIGWLLQNGIEAMAYCGNRLNHSQIRVIDRFYKAVVIIPDNDFEGARGARASIGALANLGIECIKCDLGVKGVKDIDNLFRDRKDDARVLVNLLKKKIESLETGEEK